MKITKFKEDSRIDVFVSKTSDMKTAWSDDNNVENSLSRPYRQLKELEKHLRYLQVPMALFGFFQLKDKTMDAAKVKKSIITSKATLYNIIVLVLIWLDFAKQCISFFVGENSPSYTMLKVIPVTWKFQVAVNITILLKSSHPRFGQCLNACAIWTEKVMPIMHELNSDLKPDKFKRRLLIILGIGWFTILFNITIMIFLFYYPHTSYYEILPHILISPLPINVVTRGIAIVYIVYNTVAWILPMLYAIMLCTIMKFAFKACLNAVEDANRSVKDHNIYPSCLYRQRIMHVNICKVVETFDKDLKYLYGNLCFTTVPLSCFLMYQLFKTEMDSLSMIAYSFWIIFGLMTLTITCSYAAVLNKAAHSPLDCIYETGMKGVSLEQLGQMNLFVSKLTAFPIGFSVLDFVVITKEFILTVGGIFLTYSFVLLQF